MPNSRSPLRFDHREVAVIFSLFVFVTLLMFTVGILVGKGLTQAKYEGKLHTDAPAVAESAHAAATHEEAEGTSVSTEALHDEEESHEEAEASHGTKEELHGKVEEGHPEADQASTAPPLKLLPKTNFKPNVYSGSLKEVSPGIAQEAQKVLKNPKISQLIEGSELDTPRTPASKPLSLGQGPQSFSKGPFTVQIGSYPNEKDAQERVDALRKDGFKHAYISAKSLGEEQGTWYRVWLGYYPSSESAKQNAEWLQQKGEVKNFLVRKTSDSQG